MQGFDFSAKEILVTGGSSGIGYAVAEAFAAANGNVTILAQDEGVKAAADRISERSSVRVRAVRCDIADREQVTRALGSFERIDILINNAGVEAVTPVEEKGADVEAAFRRVFDVNVFGCYYVTRDALPRMGAGGRIVFTASTWSKTAVAYMSAYCASKHAVLGMVRSFAQELGARSITVNAICPGWVKTAQSYSSVYKIAEITGRSFEELSKEILQPHALAGMLNPVDMAAGYLFLASDMARDITGQSLHVDRGELMD